jgi:hypothetical protein
VTAAMLKNWLPKYPNASPYSVLSQKPKRPEPMSFPNPVKFPVFPASGNALRHFAYNDRRKMFTLTPFPPIPLAVNTGKLADWKKATKDFLQKNNALFSDAHPFPFFVRYGYETMDDFMDGWDWRFTYDKAKAVLNADPVRYEYRLWQPIASVSINELIMNYYPKNIAAVPKKFRSMMPIEKLLINDKRFFAIY